MTFASDSVNGQAYAGPPGKRTEPRLVICEGHSDHGVLLALSKALDISGAQLHVARGRGNFRSALRAARVQGYNAILIVSDNDDNPADSWNDVCTEIKNANYSVPDKPGEVVLDEKGGPSLRVLMIPWTNEKGAIESLCLPAIENLFVEQVKCVNEFCACTQIDQNWGETARSIARVEALLACTQKATPKIGLGHFVIKSDCPIDFTHNCFKRVGEALRSFSPG